MTADKNFALVPTLRVEQMQESIRCVDVNGDAYFEFWMQDRKTVSSRMHADALITVLLELRSDPAPDDMFIDPTNVRLASQRDHGSSEDES